MPLNSAQLVESKYSQVSMEDAMKDFQLDTCSIEGSGATALIRADVEGNKDECFHIKVEPLRRRYILFLTSIALLSLLAVSLTGLGLLYSSSQDAHQSHLNAESSGKPQLMLHMGPLKTATSTIQYEFEKMNEILQIDNWMYSKSTSRICPEDSDYFDQVKVALDELLPLGRNVIMSKERYSRAFGDDHTMYQQLYDLLSDDWDVTIVSGYRPYYDWIVSYWSQGQKYKYLQYGNPDDWPWYREDGKVERITPLFPTFYNHLSSLGYFSNDLVREASKLFPVKVYSMNDKRGPAAAFVCDLVETAYAACKEATLEEEEGKAAARNVGGVDNIFWDEVGLAALGKGLLDPDKWTRYEIRNAIGEYIANELNTSIADGVWPMLCPSQDVLDEVIDNTIKFEAPVLPALAAEPGREKELRDIFEEKVASNEFCRVDTEAVLTQDVWLRFFEDYQ